MKKMILMVLAVLMMTACSLTKTVETETYSNGYCNSCSESYTVQRPVEIVYEQTTYTTVYEPKTYETKSYVRKPYDKCSKYELCD